jgi:hypothetical protein
MGEIYAISQLKELPLVGEMVPLGGAIIFGCSKLFQKAPPLQKSLLQWYPMPP